MKVRKSYLIYQDAFTAARVKTQDINIADPISSLDVIVRMTNGAGMTEASIVKPHDEFTKIEVIDGSDVIASASMKELQALNAYETNYLPLMDQTLETSAVQIEACTIPFGLTLNDPKHYFHRSSSKILRSESPMPSPRQRPLHGQRQAMTSL